MLQVSMDGPNVNCDILKLHSSNREHNEFTKLIITGNCSLHVLHNAPQTGLMEIDWGNQQSFTFNVENIR